ncbi:MAG: hypothetical protein K0R38_7672 [Polyangiaceae bacterium]|nr:hypothetical protein [Polyangiaceae bacterium]
MLFRQLFERDSSTYTYLLAGRPGGEALLIDLVKSQQPRCAWCGCSAFTPIAAGSRIPWAMHSGAQYESE